METFWKYLPSTSHSQKMGHRHTDGSKSKWSKVMEPTLLPALETSNTAQPTIPQLVQPCFVTAYISLNVFSVWPGGEAKEFCS